jgi:hypothetical protein
MTHIQNVYNIGYRGGSGGFLFLHFLLLSDQYYTSIFDNIDFSNVVAQQWNISKNKQWKKTEFWPNNYNSINDNSDLDRILYFCNPTTDEFFKQQQLLDTIVNNYNNIKDVSWPIVESAADFINLPSWIYQEVCGTTECKNVLAHFAGTNKTKSVWVYTDVESQNELAYYKQAYWYFDQPKMEKMQSQNIRIETWQNVVVDSAAVHFLNHSDIQIKLQDLVNTPELLVEHGMINCVNQQQLKLLSHWKSLHPPELLKKIGID